MLSRMPPLTHEAHALQQSHRARVVGEDLRRDPIEIEHVEGVLDCPYHRLMPVAVPPQLLLADDNAQPAPTVGSLDERQVEKPDGLRTAA